MGERLDLDNLRASLKHPVVGELSRLFEEAGKTLYLVGGSVRDALLGQVHADLDFATDAQPEQIIKIVKPWADNLWLIGIKFGTVALGKGLLKIEITTLRSERYEDASRHPVVAFDSGIELDLSRRDFTVNAMALELSTGDLIDPFHGQDDLVKRLLRTPLSPEQSFLDDPLRMMRAVRFVSTMGMYLSDETRDAIKQYKGELARVSSERVRDEFSKILTGSEPSKALRLLIETGLSDEFVPEISRLKVTQDPDYHHKDVLEHTLLVVERTEPELALRLAALFHDTGKPDTKEIIEGKVTFYNHDHVSAYTTKKRLRALKYPKAVIEEVYELVYQHMRVYTYRMGWTDKAVRKYIRDAGDLRAKLNALIRADCTTKNPRKMSQSLRVLDELEERIVELEAAEETAKIRPPVDGNEIMEYLGISPGPLVGEVMRLLLEARLDGDISTKEEALELVDTWARDKGLKE